MIKVLLVVPISIAYMFVHEMAHYVAALLLNCEPEIRILNGFLLPSIGLVIRKCNRYHHVILYSPYIVNVLIIAIGISVMHSDAVLSIELLSIGVVTLLNIPLEDERLRTKARLLVLKKASVKSFH